MDIASRYLEKILKLGVAPSFASHTFAFFFHKQHLGEDETWTMESHALGGTCGDESGITRWSFEAYFLRTLCVFQTLVPWKYGHGEPQAFRTEGLLEQLVSFMAIILVPPSWQFFFSWPWTRANLQRQLCGLIFKVYAGIPIYFFVAFHEQYVRQCEPSKGIWGKKTLYRQ